MSFSVAGHLPAVKWCFDNIGKKFFLVGSDYVFPRSANAIIKDQTTALGAEIVGEEYILLGNKNVEDMVQKIVEAPPDVILNTINGGSNISFFKGLNKAGITPDMIPTMSFSIAEDELRILGTENMVGNYTCWNYFQSVTTKENVEFVERFKLKYGSERTTDDPIEAGYFGVYLWKSAVEDAGSADVAKVRETLKRQSFWAPEGIVYLDPDNNHTWKTVRIGRIRKDGLFDIMWDSERAIQPVPFPPSRTRAEWSSFLQAMYKGWGGNWANQGT